MGKMGICGSEAIREMLGSEAEALQKIRESSEYLSRKYKITVAQVMEAAEASANFIDAGIFRNKPPLEAVCCEMKRKGFSTGEIAKRLGRSYKTIWNTLRRAGERCEENIKTGVIIPISALGNPKLGVLESAVRFLKDEEGMRLSSIAKLLKRDYRTVWTAYWKAKEKE